MEHRDVVKLDSDHITRVSTIAMVHIESDLPALAWRMWSIQIAGYMVTILETCAIIT